MSDAIGLMFGSDAWAAAARSLNLSTRDDDLLRALFTGKSEKQAAEALSVSKRAVHARLERLHRRLGVRSRTELMSTVLAALLKHS